MIKITTKRYRCSEILQEAKNPDLSMLRDKPSFKSTISDYEGLFINYGFRETAYPYTQQNAYSEERERKSPSRCSKMTRYMPSSCRPSAADCGLSMTSGTRKI